MKRETNRLPDSLLAMYPKVYRRTLPWRRVLRGLPFLLLIPIGFLIPTVFYRMPDFVESFYAGYLYPAIKETIFSVTRLIPFSLAELIVYALAVLVPIGLISALAKSVVRRAPQYFVRRVVSLALIFGIGLNLFYLTWGLNYFRKPLAGRMGLDVKPRETAELMEVVAALAEEAETLDASIRRDAEGHATYSVSLDDTLSTLPFAFERLGIVYPIFQGGVVPVKPVLSSRLMSISGIAGIYVGLTAEANVNVDQPAFSIPSAAAHETAHQLGIASEDEAEFTAFLACVASSDPFVRYSGAMQMLIRAGNALSSADPEAYIALRDTFSQNITWDLMDQAAYWKRFEGPVAEAVDGINDGYLKHNNQPSGIKSYGEAVDLLLAWYDAQK